MNDGTDQIVEDTSQPEFSLDDEDLATVATIYEIASLLLSRLDAGDPRTAALSLAMDGIGNLPQITPGLAIDFGLNLEIISEGHANESAMEFHITDCALFATCWGKAFNEQGEPDDFCDFEWSVGMNSPKIVDGAYWRLKGAAEKLLRLGADIRAEELPDSGQIGPE